MPRCSIVIPNYNDGENAVRAIESVYSPNHEVIIIDDCSEDNSIKRIEEAFGTKVRIVRCAKHIWASAIRNKGIELSTGKYIFFIDSDAYLKSETVETFVKECRGVDIVYPIIKLEDGSVMHPRSKREEEYPRMSTAFLIRRESLSRLDEYFDKDYKFTFEDEDFFTRCELLGLKSKYLPEVVVIHPKMPTDVTLKRLRHGIQNWRRKLYFLHKNRLLYYLRFREYYFLDIKRFSLPRIVEGLRYDVRQRDFESLLAFMLGLVRILLDLGKIEWKRARLKTMLKKYGY